MQHWFVYYKLEPQAARELAPRLRQMQSDAAAGEVQTRLMRRADESGGVVTLLEVYDGIADPHAFEARLAVAYRRAGLPESLAAQRRLERFEDA